MVKKESTVLTIDIGGSTLKAAEFYYPENGGVILERFAFKELVDPESDIGESFAQAYKELLAENDFKSKNVCISISGQSSFSKLSKLPALTGNTAAIQRVIEFEAKQVVPYPMEEVVWGYQLLSHKTKEEHVVTPEDPEAEPVVEIQEVDEFEALFVAVKSEHVTVFTDTILDSGREVVSVEIAPVSMFNAARATQCADDDSSILLLNIGGRCSSLVILEGGRIFVRSIPIAGNTITQQVSKDFGISFAEAEELKRRHGFVALGGAYDDPESEVAATISKIARNVMTRLHGEINRSINVWRSQHGGHPPTKMYLGGGGSLMFYTQEFFHEKLRIPVDYLNVFSGITLGENIDRQVLLDVAPMFQELVGMSLRQVANIPVDISLVPSSIKWQQEFQKKKKYFYLSAVTVIICLVVFLLAVKQRSEYSRSLVERSRGGVESTQKVQQQVRRLLGTMNQEKGEYESASKYFEDRGKWIDMLEELQTITPDNMYFVAIEGHGVEKAPEVAAESDSIFGPSDAGFGGMFADPTAMEVAAPVKVIGREFERVKAANVIEVKELKVKFYTHIIHDEDLPEEDFRQALKKSKYFSNEDDGFSIEFNEDGAGTNNIKSIVAIIKLKNPIKK